jgi:hypothetical protein
MGILDDVIAGVEGKEPEQKQEPQEQQQEDERPPSRKRMHKYSSEFLEHYGLDKDE